MSLRDVRLGRGWSQEQLAEAAGVSVRTVQRIEGGGPLGRATSIALAAALGVEVGELASPALDRPAAPVGLLDAIRHGMTGWADFAGRSSRSEFWFAFLVVVIAGAAATALDQRLGTFVLVLCLVPLLAAAIRRLRDTGHSPWWLLLVLVPFGFVVPLILLVLPGRSAPGATAQDLAASR